MFLQYFAFLVLLDVAFRLLTAILMLPFSFFVVFVESWIHRSRLGSRRRLLLGAADDGAWFCAGNQAALCVVYSILMALTTAGFVTARNTEHPWSYGLAGWLWTYFMLISNAYKKSQVASESVSHAMAMLRRDAYEKYVGTSEEFKLRLMPKTKKEAFADGASIGCVLGLLVFVVVYIWPTIVALVPGGIMALIGATPQLAEWLNTFWVVRIILGLTVFVYFLSFCGVLLSGGGIRICRCVCRS